MRPSLERHSKKSLVGSQHLSQQFIPFIVEQEDMLITKEIGGRKTQLKEVGIITDGTGCRGMEHMCAVVRVVLEGDGDVPPVVKQRLIDLAITVNSHDALKLAGFLHQVTVKVRLCMYECCNSIYGPYPLPDNHSFNQLIPPLASSYSSKYIYTFSRSLAFISPSLPPSLPSFLPLSLSSISLYLNGGTAMSPPLFTPPRPLSTRTT